MRVAVFMVMLMPQILMMVMTVIVRVPADMHVTATESASTFFAHKLDS
jgi:hypothetical protein